MSVGSSMDSSTVWESMNSLFPFKSYSEAVKDWQSRVYGNFQFADAPAESETPPQISYSEVRISEAQSNAELGAAKAQLVAQLKRVEALEQTLWWISNLVSAQFGSGQEAAALCELARFLSETTGPGVQARGPDAAKHIGLNSA